MAGTAIDFSYVLVQSLITTLIVVFAFVYDSWRGESDSFTVWERFAVLFMAALVISPLIYVLAHDRLRLGDMTYYSPMHMGHVGPCVDKLCAVRSAPPVVAGTEL